MEALLSQHPALRLVSTDLQRAIAEGVASSAPNVRKVVNTIAFENLDLW